MSGIAGIPEGVEDWLEAIRDSDAITDAVKKGHEKLYVDQTNYQSGSGIQMSEFLHLRSFWVFHEKGANDLDFFIRDSDSRGYKGYVSSENDRLGHQIFDNMGHFWSNYCQEIRAANTSLIMNPNCGLWGAVRLWQNLTTRHTKSLTASSKIFKKGHHFQQATSSGSLSERFQNMAIQTPLKTKQAPQVYGTPAATAFQMATHSPANAPSVDEMYPNVALLLLLQAITSEAALYMESLSWLPARMPLKLSTPGSAQRPRELMEARVDGYLCHCDTLGSVSNKPLAICETKPFIRSSSTGKTLRQETAEMACWISQHGGAPDGLLRSSASGRKRRLLISQDRHEIYIIIGEYGPEYEDYIQGHCGLYAAASKPRPGAPFDVNENLRDAAGSAAYVRQAQLAGIKPPSAGPPASAPGRARRSQTPPARQLPSASSFLVMHQFGPYITESEDNMKRLTRRIVALMLELRQDVSFTPRPSPADFLAQESSRSWPRREHGKPWERY